MKLFIKDKLSLFLQEKSIKQGLIIYFIIFFAIISFLLLKYQALPPQIPLFYSLPWGEERLVPPFFLLFFFFCCFLLGGFNFLLAINFYKDYPLVAKFLIWLSIFLVLIFGITAIKIIFLIT